MFCAVDLKRNNINESQVKLVGHYDTLLHGRTG